MNCSKCQQDIRAPIATGVNKVRRIPTGRGPQAGIVTTYESEFQRGATQHVDKNCSGRQGVMQVRIVPGTSRVYSRKLQQASTRYADGICNATRYLDADPTGVKGHVVA